MKAILVDLGGTLAHRTNRDRHDYSRFNEDIVEVVKGLLNLESVNGTHITILTGQRERARAITIQWLEVNGVPYDRLIMKRDNDTRDTIDFKKDMFINCCHGLQIKYVLEDREGVVKMWRSLGIKCLQVAEGQDRDFYKDEK